MTIADQQAEIKRQIADAARTALEDRLLLQIRASRLPEPIRQMRFDTKRKWQFDFAWQLYSIAVEVDGGTWSQGRHTRGDGFERDCEKNNAAVIAGWRVLHFTAAMVKSGEAVRVIREALATEQYYGG